MDSARVSRGFTLIELLVVIAIIAVLVVIVVVAIDPVERLNDANDREAASKVRSAGTLISTCITQKLSAGNTIADCDNSPKYELASYGNVPSNVAVALNGTSTGVCATQSGRDTSNIGTYQSLTGEVTNSGSVTCPD